ncbi:coatomer subunit delta, partial [Dispira parvispora]
MPRSRIEGLLASFPKLMSVGKQHTIINTESIRYVYQPMDTLYMVLITNHQSNIVQDIDTLNLFARAATDVCGGSGVHEYIVLEHCFEILCMFDEIVNLGLRENVNMAQLTTIMEMESQEEKIQEAIAKNKEREAKEELKRRAKQFDLQRKEANKHGLGGGGSPFTNSLSTFASTVKSAYSPVESTGASFDYEDRVPSALPKASGSSKSGALKGRGMKLGSKKDKHVPGLLPPGEPELVRQMETQLQLEPAAQASPEVDREDVHVQIEEHISAVINRDGGVEAMEVKGDLTLMVSNPDTSHLVLQVNADSGAGAQIKTHPQVDKKRFQNDNVLALRDASRHFPVNQPVGLLKWRVVSQDEDQLPIVINCWPSPVGDGSTEVNIEYELTAEDLELQD